MNTRSVRKLTLSELRDEFGLDEADVLYTTGKVWGVWDAGLQMLVSEAFRTKNDAELSPENPKIAQNNAKIT